MNKKIFVLILMFLFSFNSCDFVKQKVGDYYFNKAKKIASMEEVSERDIDKFYEYIMKSLDYKTDPKESIELVEDVTQASLKAGYIKSYENQLKFLKKYAEKNPKAWEVHLNIINVFSLKGDLYNLNNLKEDYERKIPADKNFKILSFMVETNLLYWNESYGELSLNNTYDEMIDYLSKYCSYSKDINDVIALKDSGFFKDCDSGLNYYFESAITDFKNRESKIRKNCERYSKIQSDTNFSKIVRYVIDGNRHLAKKEYSNAIIYYKAALSLDENFYDAKKSLIEAEFQNNLSLSLMKRDKTDVENLVYDRISDIDDMINTSNNLTKIPFSDNDKFLSKLYSLKAAMLMVLVQDDMNKNKKERMLNTIRKAVENSIKYDPQNKMAKEILSRLEQK